MKWSRPKAIGYRGYEIEEFGNGFTVFFEGDEIYFDTVDDAKWFIDGLL